MSASNLNFDYDQHRHLVSLSFYLEHELVELVIRRDGSFDFTAMEDFLRHLSPNYRIEMFSDEAVKSIARQLFNVIVLQNAEMLQVFLDEVILIIDAEAETHLSIEALIMAREQKTNIDDKVVAFKTKCLVRH